MAGRPRGLSRAGALRESVTIEAYTDTETPHGRSNSWATLATVRARVRPLSAGEQYEARKANRRSAYEVVIRHRADVTTDDRIVWGAFTLSITGVMNLDEKKQYLRLTCELGTNADAE